MDLKKIDFSELILSIRDLIKDQSPPTCKVEIHLEDGSLSFSDMEMKSNIIPLVGDTFYAQPSRYHYDSNSTKYHYDSNSTKVKVLHREISYYGLDIYEVILTVEKV